MLKSYFADMHVHIGRDLYGKPVKITGSKSLTLTNILIESSRRKGIHLVGVIDSQAPAVQEEIKQLIATGEAVERVDGGIQFEQVTLILGAEIEVNDENCAGPLHVLCYFPSLQTMEAFSHWLTDKMTNIHLSSQRYYGQAKDLQKQVKDLGGLFIPAHVFTPFKSLYGKGVDCSLREILDPELIDGIELGLSSDTSMADQISELHEYPFLTNSDAHSLAKIAREYQEIQMKVPSFKEFQWALQEYKGRKISKNFGLNPKLGKYYLTVCRHCEEAFPYVDETCPFCASQQIIKGVKDRINELSQSTSRVKKRPPYFHQVPLEYLPTLGPKTLEKLLQEFGTEMNVIHKVPKEQLIKVIPASLAERIIDMRAGKLSIQAGGGGKYGRIQPEP